MRSLGPVKLAVFSLLPGFLLFAAVEASLRWTGFRYSTTPLEARSFLDRPEGLVDRELRFRNRDGVERYVKDTRQLWVPRRSPLDLAPLEKEPGVVRIATLGDSCTAHCVRTRDSFPGLMEDELRRARAGGPPRWEVLNAGVAAYSSFQGLQRLRHVVLPYRPDYLTVYFGWNDHWIGAVPDHEIRLRGPWETRLVNLLERFRTYQGLHHLISRVRPRPAPAEGTRPGPGYSLRVPLPEYRRNLEAIAELAGTHGIRLLYITAPQEIPEDWREAKLLPLPGPQVAALHARYNDVVRSVAAERGIPLLDLAEIVAQRPPGSVLARDGIHFHPAGCRFVARTVAARLRGLAAQGS